MCVCSSFTLLSKFQGLVALWSTVELIWIVSRCTNGEHPLVVFEVLVDHHGPFTTWTLGCSGDGFLSIIIIMDGAWSQQRLERIEAIWGFEVANSWSNSSWRPHWWLPARALSSGKSCGVSGTPSIYADHNENPIGIWTYLDWIISSSQSSMGLVHQSSKSWGRKHQPLALGGSSELLGNIGADETTHPSH